MNVDCLYEESHSSFQAGGVYPNPGSHGQTFSESSSHSKISPDNRMPLSLALATVLIHFLSNAGQAFHVPVVLHGSLSLMLAGWLHAALAIGNQWQEMVYITPPLLPEGEWAPGLKLLKSKQMYAIENGQLAAPRCPGLGLDVDEDALNRYRINT